MFSPKKIFAAVINSYNRTIFLSGLYGAIFILMIIGYRIEIFRLIRSIYPDFLPMSFMEYIHLSLHFDSAVMFFSLAVFIVTAVITARIPRFQLTLFSIMSVLTVLFLLISIDFFKTYETTFQKSFLGAEHATALPEMARSFWSEVTLSLIARFTGISLSIVILSLVIFQREKKKNRAGEITRNRAWGILPPVLLLILFIITRATSSDNRYLEAAARYPSEPRQQVLKLLKEVSMNPVYNLFSSKPAYVPPGMSDSAAQGPFSLRLDTTSLVSSRIFKKIDVIPRGKKYNVVFYFFESTPSKYLKIKLGGNYIAETWNRLEKNSFAALNHYANYPLSANAMLSVFTSAYSMDDKLPAITRYPDIPLKTVSEILNKTGYRTCLIHTGGLKYAGQDRFLKNRRFDKILEYHDLKRPPYEDWVGWGLHERSMIQPGISFMEEDRSRPFFVAFFPVNPHHPYAIPDESYNITGPIPAGLDYRKKNRLKYINSLHYTDAILGELITAMEEQGLMDNTLFFVFSDHGEAFYQHERNYNHPMFLYEENVHVPFLIYNRRFFKETVYYDGISRHIDILPTLLDILDIKPLPEQEGISLFSRHHQQMAFLSTTWKDRLLGLRDGAWKYIYRPEDGFEELYDLNEDPEEKTNRAGDEKKIAERYRAFVNGAARHQTGYYHAILGGGEKKCAGGTTTGPKR